MKKKTRLQSCHSDELDDDKTLSSRKAILGRNTMNKTKEANACREYLGKAMHVLS